MPCARAVDVDVIGAERCTGRREGIAETTAGLEDSSGGSSVGSTTTSSTGSFFGSGMGISGSIGGGRASTGAVR